MDDERLPLWRTQELRQTLHEDEGVFKEGLHQLQHVSLGNGLVESLDSRALSAEWVQCIATLDKGIAQRQRQ